MVSLHQAFKLGHALAFPDAKKSVWVPDGEGGYDEAMIDNIEGEKVNLRTFLKNPFSLFYSRLMSKWAGRKRLSRRVSLCKSTRLRWKNLKV